MKKIGKFNLLTEEVCKFKKCKCGWNLHIGGIKLEDLKKIKEFIKNIK